MIPSRFTRWIWIALIALQIVWFAVLHPPQALPLWMVLSLVLVPLLLPLPWILKLRPQALVFGGLMLLLHFSIAVAETWTKPEVRVVGLVQIALIVAYYLALPGVRRGRSKRDAPQR